MREIIIQVPNSRIVVDPFAFFNVDDPLNDKEDKWYNPVGAYTFYKDCGEMGTSIQRTDIDIQRVNYIDYKITSLSAKVKQQEKFLEKWLTSPNPHLKFLHISLDDERCSSMELLDYLPSFNRWYGLLGIQIADRSKEILNEQYIKLFRKRFDLDRLISLDYIKTNFTSPNKGQYIDLLKDVVVKHKF